MAAARSTLGSVRASSTKPTIPATPTTPSQRPRTPTQRATTSRNPTTRVRFVPETAVRCVRPVVRKSSTSPGGIPASSPSTSAGTSACWLAGRWATASRIEARRASVARQAAPAAAAVSGGPRGVTVAARSPASSTGASRPVKRIRSPIGDPLPGVVAEHQDGLVPTHRDPHQHPVAEATLDPPRVARHRARQGHQGALLGGRRDRAGAHRLGPDQRHHPDPGGDGQHRQRGEGRPPRAPARRRPPATARPRPGRSPRRTPGCHRTSSAPAHAARPRSGSRRSVGPVPRGRPTSDSGCSQRHVRRELGQGDLADAVHVEELVDRGEGAVLGAARPGSTGRSRGRRRAATRGRPGRRC